MRPFARDVMTLSKREITPRGYLVAPAVIGRCGVQVYTRGELGLDGDQRALVRLMRLPEEVFRAETVKSFDNVPITDDHPRDGVDASNWRDEARGHLRDPNRNDGDLLGAQTIVMDGETVTKIVSGKSALSCGYTFDLDLTPGIAPDGTPFDGYQRNILGDHVAIVDSPRGGPVCRIGDKKKEATMATRKLIVDGLPLELDEVHAAAVERVVQDRDRLVKELSAAGETHNATIAAKDTEIATLKTSAELAKREAEDRIKAAEAKILTDAQIDERVEKRAAERAEVQRAADALGVKTEPKPGKTVAQMRREVLTAAVAADEGIKSIVTAVVGADGLDKADDGTIAAVLGTIAAGAKGKRSEIADQDARVIAALSGKTNETVNTEGAVLFGADGYRQ